MLLLAVSCKKKHDKDISHIINSSYLYNTWIITDDDKKKAEQTEKTQFFSGKKGSGKEGPKLRLNRNFTYCFIYLSTVTGDSVYEYGRFRADEGLNALVFDADSASNSIWQGSHFSAANSHYVLQVNKLDEEDLLFLNSYQTVKDVKDNEGVTHQQTVTEQETLYMADDDWKLTWIHLARTSCVNVEEEYLFSSG